MQSGRNISPQEILARLVRSRGDRGAWEQLYYSFWHAIMAMNYRLLRGDYSLAEDASQEVFLRLMLYCDFRKFGDPSAFYGYLKSICRNVTRNIVAAQNELPAPALDEDGSTPQIENLRSTELSPETSAEINELIDKILGRLNARDRAIAELLIAGGELPEIAQWTGLGYFTAGARISRLRAKIKQLREQLRSVKKTVQKTTGRSGSTG